MKPSTVAALLAGDMENAIVSETPGGIEAQEAQGQRDFVASTTLPSKCLGCTREQLEEMGIVFGEETGALFVEAQLPGGWNKRPTNHSMWSELVDAQGRVRALMFYKAAFYDRCAHIELVRRFRCDSEPIDGWDSRCQSEWAGVVFDCNEAVWKTEERVEPEPEDVSRFREWDKARYALEDAARAWLDEHYPEWHDPLAYWD